MGLNDIYTTYVSHHGKGDSWVESVYRGHSFPNAYAAAEHHLGQKDVRSIRIFHHTAPTCSHPKDTTR